MKLVRWIANFIWSMLSENGVISHKRFISVSAALTMLYLCIYTHITNKTFDHYIFAGLVAFILIMSGVATVAQVLSIWKGTPNQNKTESLETKEVTQPKKDGE
jgi:hypothetical protein